MEALVLIIVNMYLRQMDVPQVSVISPGCTFKLGGSTVQVRTSFDPQFKCNPERRFPIYIQCTPVVALALLLVFILRMTSRSTSFQRWCWSWRRLGSPGDRLGGPYPTRKTGRRVCSGRGAVSWMFTMSGSGITPCLCSIAYNTARSLNLLCSLLMQHRFAVCRSAALRPRHQDCGGALLHLDAYDKRPPRPAHRCDRRGGERDGINRQQALLYFLGRRAGTPI